MRYTLPIFTAFLLGISYGALAQDDKMSDGKMSDKKMAGHKMAGGADAKFAKNAAAGGMTEVKLGQLAQDKGSSDFVKQFGKKMVEDHTKAGDDLKAVAEKNKMTLPSDIMPKQQATYDRLSKLSGTAFDQAYIAAMKKDHAEDIKEFTQEANNGQNADLKDFASKTLPTVKSHMDMLQNQKVM